MIDPKTITTYAQYNEDLILKALFKNVKRGFYVDVGANYPTIDSVTKSFYDQGWTGINIEPIKSLVAQLNQERPKDTNLQCGAGDKPGNAVLREYKDVAGHSTFDSSQKVQHDKKYEYVDYEVPIKTLKQIFDERQPKHLHFIKIDVEGFEYQVIKGNDWNIFRPEVICIEANHVSHDWRPILLQHKYKLFIQDGLNEYYVAHESWARTEGFAERIIELDYHALKQHQAEAWSADSEELTRLHKVAADQQQQINGLREQLGIANKLATLTLRGQPWLVRLKRASIALTTDWYRYKKQPKSKTN